MSVWLVTGQPGSGKTAHVVDLIANDPQFKGRPLFQMGIPELALEHQSVPPVAEWVEHRQSPEDATISLPYFVFPSNSVIVIDEAQRVFRPRPVGSKVPAEVQAFETHRHTGVDFILVTQHPNLIDSNVRKLIGRHFHVHVTSFGRSLLDWPRLGEVDSKTDRELAIRKKYSPPKRVFDLYKSAEAHTVIKRKLPWQFWVAIGAAVVAVALVIYTVQRVRAKSDTSAPASVQGSPVERSSAPAGGGSSGGSDGVPHITKAAYYADRIPRLEGVHHTAPVYDEITKPQDAPFPVGCMKISAYRDRPAKCVCQDQQGNDYATTQAVCEGIVQHGIFREFSIKYPEYDQAKKPEKSIDSGKTENSGSKNSGQGGESLPNPDTDRS